MDQNHDDNSLVPEPANYSLRLAVMIALGVRTLQLREIAEHALGGGAL